MPMHLNMNKYADDATFIFFFNFSKTKYFLHVGRYVTETLSLRILKGRKVYPKINPTGVYGYACRIYFLIVVNVRKYYISID